MAVLPRTREQRDALPRLANERPFGHPAAMAHRDEQGWLKTELGATIALAWPLILTNVAQALIPATDVVLLGWAGPRALAAGALGTNLYNACLVLGIGLMSAASPMIARTRGGRAHDIRNVRRTVRQGMWAAVTLMVPMWLLLAAAEPILIAFGQDRALAHDAARLVHPMMLGLLPMFLYQVLRAFVAALERPAWAFVASGTAVVTNALLNYALIFGAAGFPRLGLVGAGIGSSVSSLLMVAILAIVVLTDRRFRRYHLFGRFWRSDWPRYRDVWRLGTPIALTLGFEVTIFNCAVFLQGLIGTAELAAHAVAIQIASLCFMIPLGLAQAATVRVGLAYGRRDRTGIARAGAAALGVTLVVMTVLAAALLAIPRPLVGLFLDLHDPAQARVVALAVSFLTVAALFQLVDGTQAVGAGMLRGLHDTKMPMLFAALGYWVIGLGTAVGLAFHFRWGGIGVWIGLAAGLAVVSVLMVGRWLARERLGLVPDLRSR